MHRPFYFIVVCWGERFTRYLTDYCIASLLSPGNIPAMQGSGHKFIVACPDEDFERLKASEAWPALSRYVEIVHIKFTPAQNGDSACVQMGAGHILATEMAFRDKAIGVQLTPDQVLSDGAVAFLQRKHMDGYKVVLAAALRFADTPLLDLLEPARDGCVLTLPPRKLTEAALQSLHPETESYAWGHPQFNARGSAVWWPVDGGMLVCSLSWAALLFDYGALKYHDVETLRKWTMDGDYVYRNFGDSEEIYIVRDSDEAMQVSFTPHSCIAMSVSELDKAMKEYPKMRDGRAFRFSRWIKNSRFDPIKKRVFLDPVRWHSGGITETWLAEERRIIPEFREELNRALHVPEGHPRAGVCLSPRCWCD